MASTTLPGKHSIEPPTNAEVARYIAYNARTLWLFTRSDIKTIIAPSIAFALINGLAFRQVSLVVFISRFPFVLLWVYVNILALVSHNQRDPEAIKEDQLNKPWRPIAAGRITPGHAETLSRVAYACGVWISLLWGGGSTEASLLVVLGHLYNGLGWNRHWAIRNFINAAGITTFLAGTLSAAARSPISVDMVPWLVMVAAVIATTIHSQDMHDQPGDSAAGRKTIPLVLGDGPTRWTIAVPVLLWSVAAPWYWSSAMGFALLAGSGAVIAWRTLTKRSVAQDRTTFTIYNVWLMGIYMLPFASLC
ncbi:hypothetical protein GQ53DRAFT_886247 [Thozetella sp. PMI_491]|nr:hypothetical protein GQ53DRAFT_886247 [Thozetella sp. PMI_491]